MNASGRPRPFLLLLSALLGVLPVALAAASAAGSIPIELLARRPEIGQMQLSPTGSHIAYTRVDDQDLVSLEILNLSTGEKKGVAGTTNYDVGAYAWVDEDELVLILTREKLSGVGIYAYDMTSGRLAAISELQGISLVSVPRDRDDRVVGATYGDPGVLIELTTRFDRKTRGFGTNANPVRRRYTTPDERFITGYLADVTGEPAIAVSYNDEGEARAYLLDLDTETWRRLDLDAERTSILAVTADRKKAWVAERTADGGSALALMNLVTAEREPALYQDSDYDLSEARLYLSEDGRDVRGIAYTQVRAHSVWFDDALKAAYGRLATAFPGFDHVLVDLARHGTLALFVVRGSSEPGQYFLADLESGEVKHVVGSAPWLQGQPLATTRSLTYAARDGLKLQAYLTLPNGHTSEGTVPLIVLPHGGPWHRDDGSFDPEVQFLTSRGYAVLQPNFRGSTGFSRSISDDDRFRFRKMHEDVTDAVHAVVTAGLADPKRLGIMGASFGGYLAVAGAAFEPDLYRCAITNVGVFDWEQLLEDTRRSSRASYLWLRDNVAEHADELGTASPINALDQVKIPVFIAHGSQDDRVNVRQSARLERGLIDRGVPCETFYRKRAGHGFGKAEDRQAYLEAVEAFLSKHLPVN